MGRVSGEVNQDVDAVAADLVAQRVIVDAGDRPPAFGQRLQAQGNHVFAGKIVIAGDFEPAAIVRRQYGCENRAHRMAAQVRRHITDAQAALGVAIVVKARGLGVVGRRHLFGPVPVLGCCLVRRAVRVVVQAG